MRGFPSGLTLPWRVCSGVSRGRANQSTAARPSVKLADYSVETRERPGVYTIKLVDDAAACPGKLRLQWSIRPEWDEWAHHSEGCYLLRSNLPEWSAEELWRTYIQLYEAEAAFRIHKSELSIRPIWHQRADRVLAHILVCFLAYVLWKTLEKWQSSAGLGNSPRTILQELGAIHSTDVVLATATVPQRELRLRCIVRPDRAQSALLQRLGLRLPERLRISSANQMHQM